MDEGPSPRDKPERSRPSPFRRRLSLGSRIRGVLRRGADRVLAASWVSSALFVVTMMALLETERCGVSYERYAVGETARHDIVASHDLDLRDDDLTRDRRRAASEAVPDVYFLDTRRGERLIGELSSVFETGRELFARGLPAEAGAWDALERRTGPQALDLLRGRRFDAGLEAVLQAVLRRVLRNTIVVNKALLVREPAILVARFQGGEERVSDYAGILDLDEARERVRTEAASIPGLAPEEAGVVAEFLAGFVDSNLAFDPERTHARKEAAAAAVPTVLIRVPRGSPIVRKGETLTPESLEMLEAAREAASRRFGAAEALGTFTVVAMLAFFLHRYTRYHQRNFKKIRNLHALLVLVLLLMMLLARGMLWIVRGLVDDFVFPFDQPDVYTYLIPLGGGAILVTLLANGRIATVYSAFAAVLFSALTGWDSMRLIWALLVQLAAVYAISAYRERAALLRAGLVVGGAGAALALAAEVLRGTLEPLQRSLFGAGLAFVGGAVGVGLLVSFTLPMFEDLFHVLTDVRLLELSNINHPLIAELAVRAPGSYNHSVMVGTLAQEAAKAIGANPLFCRVAAFYHDIGKIQKPEYYVENQHGVNPHERLSPTMSALVIAAHVKDGIRMARDARLPEQIVDIIPQHHGTRVMTYFYEKAKKSADPALGPVNEANFRYPGPKPQTEEAAIFMLADAVEAAARTVDDPSPNRLREMIRKVTNAVVLDRQLDECELTFADLGRIQEAFLRTLVSMHHHRLEYPGFTIGRPKESREMGERRVAKGGG